jgi:hypothetical protein
MLASSGDRKLQLYSQNLVCLLYVTGPGGIMDFTVNISNQLDGREH